MTNTENLEFKVSQYYECKLQLHGATPKGVDWRDENAQNWRFEGQLHLALKHNLAVNKILDYGCGYGEFLNYLRSKGFVGRYLGFDISKKMIEEAKKIHRFDNNSIFSTELNSPEKHDVCFSSGTFNVMFSDRDNWLNDFVKPNIVKMLKYSENVIVGFLNSNPSYVLENLLYIEINEISKLLPSNIYIKDSLFIENTWEYCLLLCSNSEKREPQ